MLSKEWLFQDAYCHGIIKVKPYTFYPITEATGDYDDMLFLIDGESSGTELTINPNYHEMFIHFLSGSSNPQYGGFQIDYNFTESSPGIVSFDKYMISHL